MQGSAVGGSGDARSRVLQATDIVELIGHSVALKRRGKNFVGLCPFHKEKTPSFQVDPSKQSFYCYGCKKGGNAIDFVIERDRVEFRDALNTLADAAGIELPKFGPSQNAGERQNLLDAHSAACGLFEKLLADPLAGQAARQYLQSRGFNAESISRFRIGLSANAWDGLTKNPAMKRFSPSQLALAGLAKPKDNGGHYDTFRNRLMFPIRDESGRVIAFGGREMPDSENPPKYLNSPETPLFTKNRCIFGIDQARAKIVETRTVAVVEGYTDVVMAHQFGATNVVSPLGTALTENHVSILRRFADRIVLLFDPDTAGDAAVDRVVELFLTQPVEIAIASLPDGMDPDEFLLAKGLDEFNRVLADATDVLTYKWKQLERRFKSDDAITSQQRAVQDYLETLAAARNAGPAVDTIRWGGIISRVNRLTGISIEDLYRRFKPGGTKRKSYRKSVATAPAAESAQAAQPGEPNYINPVDSPVRLPDARIRAEGFLIGLMLLDPNRWSVIQRDVAPADFDDPGLREIAEIFWRHQQDEGPPVFNEFLGFLKAELKGVAVQWANEAEALPDPESGIAGSLKFVQDHRKREQGKKQASQFTAADNNDDAREFLRQYQENVRQPDLRRFHV